MIVMTPGDENECRQMLYTGHLANQPAAVRYPRGAGKGITPDAEMTALPIGKSRTLREGKRVALLNFGTLLPYVERAAETLDATLVDMRFVKPLDTEILDRLQQDHDVLVSVEDGCIMGGAGSAVAEYLLQKQYGTKLLQIGLPDSFILQGTQEEMYAELKLDDTGIVEQVKAFASQ